jgi:recombination protein RecT
MAIKTMLRQLISKWGVMSIEFQKAYEADMGVVKEDNSIEYVDTAEEINLDPITEADYEIIEAEEVKEGVNEDVDADQLSMR